MEPVHYEFDIYLTQFPDAAAVSKEHQIRRDTACPSCGEKALGLKMQSLLGPKPDSDFMMGGDRLDCECERCGQPVSFTFHFKAKR